MPWETPLEAKMGDKCIFYYLSVINALKPQTHRYIIEGKDRYIFIDYQFIYALVRDGKILPVNGYVLIEAIEDPAITREKERMKALNMELVVTQRRSNNQVTFGKVKYTGTPNRQYVDDFISDEGVDVAVGDTVVIRKTNDIPLQYSLHAKLDDGASYLRVQRKSILAKI
jgi:hypothetical protein